MKALYQFSRFFVGGLFIFSGLIKVNDPIGTAIKLQEYFEVFTEDISSLFHFFIPYALVFSVLIVTLEVVLGIAVLLEFKPKISFSILLGLIVFFTFLTFYSAYFNKVTDCGCFGDFIKLTPWQSFTKDIVLLVFCLVLFLNRGIQSSKNAVKNYFLIGFTAFTLFLAVYAIMHLPFIDFRNYKIGNDIAKLMQPEEAPKFAYIFEKDGEQVNSESWLNEEDGYKYLEMITLNPDKSTPKIPDFGVFDFEGESLTDSVLSGKQFILVFHNVDDADDEHLPEISNLINELDGKINLIALSSSGKEITEPYRHKHQLALPFAVVDATVLKAVIRSNPGIWVLNNGVVKGKWHHNDVPSAEKVLSLVNE